MSASERLELRHRRHPSIANDCQLLSWYLIRLTSLIFPTSRLLCPRRKDILLVFQRIRKGREVSYQDILHRGIRYPVEAFGSVRLLIELRSDEPIALQPPRCHQDEDPELRIAEAESLGERLDLAADDHIDHLDVLVDLLQLLSKRFVASGEFDEGLWVGHVQLSTHLAISGHASFTIAEDVDGG